MVRTFFLLISTMCLCSLPALASDTIGIQEKPAASFETKTLSIYTLEIEGLIGKSAANKYNKLFQKISELNNIDINIVSVPGKRLERTYIQAGKGCIFPDYRTPQGMKGLFSTPFNHVKIYRVTRKNSSLPESQSIAGLTIGIVNGYGYDFIDLNTAKSVTPMEDERQNLDLLLHGRVDAIISYFPDLPLVMSAEEESLIQYDKNKPLFISPEKLGCYDNDSSKEFLKVFSSSIVKLNRTGELATILAPYFYGHEK